MSSISLQIRSSVKRGLGCFVMKKTWYRKRLIEIPDTILVSDQKSVGSNLANIGTRLKRIARYLESTGLIYHLVDGKEKEGIWYNTKKEIGNKKKKGNFKPRFELLHSIAKHTPYMRMCILLQPDYSLRSFSQTPKTNCGLSDDYETNFVHNYSDWLTLTYYYIKP